jgi:ankyrin repeat protein
LEEEGNMKAVAFLVTLFGVSILLPLDALAANLIDIADTATPDQIQQAVKGGSDSNAADSVGRTVLMIAAASNPDPAVISLLVKAGAKVNARGPRGWTALMMAAYSNPNPEVVVTLLKAGADPTLRSGAGETAWVYAQDNDKLKGTQALQMMKTARK